MDIFLLFMESQMLITLQWERQLFLLLDFMVMVRFRLVMQVLSTKKLMMETPVRAIQLAYQEVQVDHAQIFQTMFLLLPMQRT